MKTRFKFKGSAAPLAFAMAMIATSASAQNVTASEDAGDNVIIVTGSRILSQVPTSVAPVQVIGQELIQNSGAVNIQETLLENPVFGSPTYSRTNTSFNTSGAGLATVDLRNLGIDRTLVLINGRRVVSGVPGSAAVDLNMIPTQMIKRTEVLTSGSASAVYGSDAVAGVVNFILKDDFDGVELNAQSGIAETGDNRNWDAGALFGRGFGDGRGNVTLFVGYSKQGAVYLKDHKTEAGASDRDSISDIMITGGDVFTPVRPFYSSYAPQGRYFTDNYSFTYGPTGTLQPCFTSNSASCDSGVGTGPNGFNRTAYRYLAVPVQRYTVSLNAHFDLTENITAFLEGAYVRTTASSNIEPFPFGTDNAYGDGQMPIETLYNGTPFRNPFVPMAIYDDASDTNDDGLRDIYVTKRLSDFGPRATRSRQETFRIMGGIKGEVAQDWNYEAFVNYGQSDVQQRGTGQINIPHFLETQQIVPNGSGGYMCAKASARAEGCVPANVFGLGSMANAMGYLAAPSLYKAVQKQTQIGANLSGFINNPLGADRIGLTVGAEYRNEAQDSRWDELQTAGLNGGNALPPTTGKFNVKEAYGEVLVPLLSDSLFHELSIRGAARISDYSTIGQAFSWNAGAEFAPIRDIRFRGMYAQTVRAPNISELFSGLSQDFPQVGDPCEGIGATGGGALGANCRAAPGVATNIAANGVFTLTQADIQGTTSFSGGNPNLSDEKGKTLTLGVVINPQSIDALRNLSLSVDYFRVKVKGAIVGTPLDFILDQCYEQGNAGLCDFIVRRPAASGPNSAGSLDEVNSGVTNSGGLKTSGVDFTLNYGDQFNLGKTQVNANISVAYTHLLSGLTVPLPGEAADFFEGEIGAAKDRFTVNTALGTDRFKLSATGTYVGASWIDDQFDGFHAYKVHPEFYLDLQARFFVKGGMEFYVGADNVLNNSPAYFAGIPDATTGMETNTGVYDPLGRRFYVGVRVKL